MSQNLLIVTIKYWISKSCFIALTSILFWYGISIYCCYLCNAKPAQPSSKGGSILDVFDVVNGQLRDIQIIVGKYLTEYRKSFPNDQDDEFDVTCCQKITIMSHDPLVSRRKNLNHFLVYYIADFSQIIWS